MEFRITNKVIEQRIVDALEKQEHLYPRAHELGGGIYYTCYWLACNETVYRWMNYCPKCGQKLLWNDE